MQGFDNQRAGTQAPERQVNGQGRVEGQGFATLSAPVPFIQPHGAYAGYADPVGVRGQLPAPSAGFNPGLYQQEGGPQFVSGGYGSLGGSQVTQGHHTGGYHGYANPRPYQPGGYKQFGSAVNSGGKGAYPFACDNCGQQGHGYSLCPHPLDEARVAGAMIQRQEAKMAREARMVNVNAILASRGMGQLQQMLPSEREAMRRAGLQQQSAQPQPQGQQGQPQFPMAGMTPAQGPTPGPIPPPPDEDKWLLKWGPFSSVLKDPKEVDRRLQSLRGYKEWAMSKPFDGGIVVTFVTEADAAAAKCLLQDVYMIDDGGTPNRCVCDGPTKWVPPPPPPQVEEPDPTQPAKRPRIEADVGGGMDSEVETRFQAIESSQQAQGKQLENLERKIMATGTEVTEVSNNVASLVHGQKIARLREARGWHEIGRLDMVAKKTLRAAAKLKVTRNKTYYVVAPDDEEERYVSQEAVVIEATPKMITYQRTTPESAGSADLGDMMECEAAWVFGDPATAVERMESLNGVLASQEKLMDDTLVPMVEQ